MNTKKGNVQSNKGSLWNRWEPHIHTPGTALNDQFIGDEAWEGFLTGIEAADPQVSVLGITDYFSIHRYKEVLAHRDAGRLANVGFIFPNVELRLSIETSKASAINLHILFDPAPSDHIEEIERFLLELEFNYRDSTYRCHKSDLIRLGKAHDPSIRDDHAALSEGANQFKVNFDQLKSAWKKNAWVQSHALIALAADQKRQVLDAAKLKLQTLLDLQAEVRDFRDRRAPEIHADFKEGFREAVLSEDDWKSFSVIFSGDVDSTLLGLVAKARKEVKSVEGPSETDPPIQDDPDPLVVLVPVSTDLTKPTLSLLERELARLSTLVNADGTNRKRFNLLTEKITKAGTALEKVLKQIASAQGAGERIKELQAARMAAYQGVFEAVIDEESELKSLYDPIRQRLQAEAGSLSKLSFSVDRQVDLDSWAETGEDLLDLRVSGPFKGRGELLSAARSELLDAWQSGDAVAAASALSDFLKNHEEGLRKHRPESVPFKDWVKPISAWLYGTDHIRVGYGLEYEGTKIEQLSPGTRGIVLLLLYLAIDAEDDRPLLIDQPEENLDPQSIFNELVNRFRDAKLRRQIIIVTHNANLVVNTDADQVIVASCGPHRPGELPIISYQSGGLENETIRKAVCEILEGGERAFKERAKRLRVEL